MELALFNKTTFSDFRQMCEGKLRTAVGQLDRKQVLRVIEVIDAPWFKIINGTGAFSTSPAKLLRNRRFRSNYLGHLQIQPQS